MIRAKPVDTTKVIAYTRVSTTEQAREGISLDDQRRRVAAYCEAHGLSLAAVESDDGISGKNTANRPGLQRALEALNAGTARGLVVVKLDRLTRSLRDVIDLITRSEREGWQLHSIGESLDTSTPHGRFVVHLFGALAQLEREQIADRTRTAMSELRRQGKRTSRNPPLGYRFEDGHVVPVEGEQAILARIRALEAQGLGCVRITRALNGEGNNPRVNRAWNVGTVRAILKTIARRREEAGSCAN